MKQTVLFVLTACLLLSLTACGGGSTHIEVSDPSISSTITAPSQVASTEEVSSEPEVSSVPTQTQDTTSACQHQWGSATCTTAAKCTLCGVSQGKSLGHSYKSGACTRCGAKDANYATYKNGGKDTIIRTTATGKETALKIDISSAEARVSEAAQNGTKLTLVIERKHFFEKDGWLYFVQSNIYDYNGNKSESYEFFRIRTDGSKQKQIKTLVVTDDKGVAVAGIFGMDNGKLYYSVEDADNGTYAIYSATLSTELTDLTRQGKKLEEAEVGCYFENYKLKDGWLYYSLTKAVYNPKTGKADITDMGDYKIKTDGTGKKKVS